MQRNLMEFLDFFTKLKVPNFPATVRAAAPADCQLRISWMNPKKAYQCFCCLWAIFIRISLTV